MPPTNTACVPPAEIERLQYSAGVDRIVSSVMVDAKRQEDNLWLDARMFFVPMLLYHEGEK